MHQVLYNVHVTLFTLINKKEVAGSSQRNVNILESGRGTICEYVYLVYLWPTHSGSSSYTPGVSRSSSTVSLISSCWVPLDIMLHCVVANVL